VAVRPGQQASSLRILSSDQQTLRPSCRPYFPSHRRATGVPTHAQHLPSWSPYWRQLGLAGLRRLGAESDRAGRTCLAHSSRLGAGLATALSAIRCCGLDHLLLLVARSEASACPSSAQPLLLYALAGRWRWPPDRPQRWPSCPWRNMVSALRCLACSVCDLRSRRQAGSPQPPPLRAGVMGSVARSRMLHGHESQ